jgi:hypothetical protein
VFLADKFFERPRPHAGSQRRGSVHAFKIDIFFVEQILHWRKYGASPSISS